LPRSLRTDRATRVLVVDDDLDFSRVLSELLSSTGRDVRTAESGSAARASLAEFPADLVILDLMLPDEDGLALCAHLRARLDVPIIVCSGTNRRHDGPLALRLGADDFLAKPFDLADFEARVDAVLRRASSPGPQRPAEESAELSVGNLFVSRTRRHVRMGDEELLMTPTEYRLVYALASHPDKVVSRSNLADSVWGYQDATMGRTIDVHIRRLRVKLGACAASPPAILAVRGEGYEMLSPGEALASAA
jgi:DNA-binding response OmpR family regulator